jgi:hypothetical protein
VQDAGDELTAAGVHDRGAGALQQVVLVAGDHRGDDHERDERPYEHPERLGILHQPDHLADEQRLDERGQRADDAEDCDDDQRALVLEEEGEELAERGARTILRRAASAAASGRRAGHA